MYVDEIFSDESFCAIDEEQREIYENLHGKYLISLDKV